VVGYPSNVLVVSDYEPYHWKEHVPYRIDFILSCGDNSIQALADLYERYRKPIFAVREDHDGLTPFGKGVLDVHMNPGRFRNWIIGGFSGVPYYKQRGQNMWSEEEASSLLQKMPRCDVFICHAPVAEATDKPESYAHPGSIAIRRYVEAKKPRFVYHGHVHRHPGIMIGDTAVVSVFGHKVVHLQMG
jgi:Icc-related predicted phosphoesterase